MLDAAVVYVAQDSRSAAERLLVQALDTAASLDTLSERGRIVPEFNQPAVRELFVQRYRLIYEVTPTEFRFSPLFMAHATSHVCDSTVDGVHANRA
jgi:hypothetical protein